MAKVDKVIVGNDGALQAKYGAKRSQISKAIASLVAADKKRGMATEYVAIDDAAQMAKLGGTAVSHASDQPQNKAAIDAVYRALTPDYLMILGATDIIPHQDVTNPISDEDALAPGDLAYACDAPYGRDINAFLGPTRVVGRLPDVTGVANPAYLVGLLQKASAATSLTASEYDDCHAVSAQIWQGSTQLSVKKMFGAGRPVSLVPPAKPPWPAASFSHRMHFYNCHGAQASPEFYGQPKSGAAKYPVSLASSQLVGKVKSGTVVAAECCYGGELYAPTADLDPPICNRYLENGAYGMLASTTIAYGPATGNGSADLITQFFLERVHAGASLGRAALEARQRFVAAASPMHPADRKTLAQFNLYGDPSITPVAAAVAEKALRAVAAARTERNDRRMRLTQEGRHLLDTEPKLRRSGVAEPRARQALRSLAAPNDQFQEVHRFEVDYPEAANLQAHALTARRVRTSFLVGYVRPAAPADAAARVRPTKVVIGREVDGQLVSAITLLSR